MQTPEQLKLGFSPDTPLCESELDLYRDALKKNARQMLGKQLRGRLGSSDLVQETLVVTIMNLSTVINRPKRAVYQWMISVMRHRVLKHARAEKIRKREESNVAQPIGVQDLDLNTEMIHTEFKELVFNQLANMDELSQRIFELRYLESLRVDEIAVIVGRSKDSVRSHLYRTLEKIRCELKESMS